ncbi:MAG: hypothetical protein ACWA5T_10440 [Parvularcula sp.]
MKIRSHIFGWLTPHLAPVIRQDAARLDLYLGLSRADWHYFGLIVALMGDKASCPDHFASVEREAWSRARLNVMRGVYDGKARALLNMSQKFTGDLWRPPSYRRVARAIEEPAFLSALRGKKAIDRRFVRALSAVPPHLRVEAVTRRIRTRSDADRVVFLAEVVRRIRTDLSDQEVLRSLSQVKRKGAALEAWVAGHYQHAPFPAAPWEGDGALTPITSYAALKRLALEFDNCVRSYHEEVLSGQSYFYRYALAGKPVATVELEFLPHVGWSVGDVEGPKNASIGRAAMGDIKKRFGRAGIVALPRDTSRWDLFRAA